MPAEPRQRSRSPRRQAIAPEELKDLKALVVNLDRRADRWARCEEMLNKETPWLPYERFSASDGSKMEIPESEICTIWNTKYNAEYGDYDEWVFDAPGTPLDGAHWKWPDQVGEEDPEWKFSEGDEDGEGEAEKVSTKEKIKVKKVFAERFREPGQVQRMSGGERGCAHSHRRLWEVISERSSPTLVLEDDAQLVFDRTDSELGKFNGKLFAERLCAAMKEVPADFDVMYLGWSGWRGGHFKKLEEEDSGEAIRKVEYVWTTVAYVITPSAAQKLLQAATPMNQPVDNFMAWEASQGRLKSFVVLDVGDDDDCWSGGIVDQADFQGDSDIQKSDGGVQGDDVSAFAVASGGQ